MHASKTMTIKTFLARRRGEGVQLDVPGGTQTYTARLPDDVADTFCRFVWERGVRCSETAVLRVLRACARHCGYELGG